MQAFDHMLDNENYDKNKDIAPTNVNKFESSYNIQGGFQGFG